MTSEDPIGVIAGNGRLPFEVLSALRDSGQSTATIAIKGEADVDLLSPFAPKVLGWGQIGGMLDHLHKAGCQRLLMIGGVSQRPDFRSIVGDLGTVRRLPRIVRAMTGGDDSLLRKVIGLIEDDGFKVVGVGAVAPSLLGEYGQLGLHAPKNDDLTDIEIARKAAATIGRLDIGQAVVVVNAHVVAVEAAEGTDAVLSRVAELRTARRIDRRGNKGVLLKLAKPGQDLRVDLPAIGPETVAGASAAGLNGIVVEAGRVLIADRRATIAAADAAGLFVYGVERLSERPETEMVTLP